MCDPASAMLAISVASSVAGGIGSNKQARAQIEANNAAATAQQDQLNAQAALDTQERSRQGARERATMRVSAGESGVAGASPLGMLMDSLFQEGYDNSITEYNRSNAVEASSRENYARNVDAAGRAQSALETGLQIAGATASYANTKKAAGEKPFWSR